ncbi:hypothetical protein AHF37_02326 [Paragonimus kellicotti]|nr:hypothetical protein AHF37_02326 [Paragonimus kellicotti]
MVFKEQPNCHLPPWRHWQLEASTRLCLRHAAPCELAGCYPLGSTVSRQCSSAHLRKRRTIIMILIVCLLGLFLFSKIHSRDFSDLTDVDPLLDPRLNPHIVVDHGAAAAVDHALVDRRETQLRRAERLD